MNKGTLLETLETVLVVTVIAVLIWLFAEGETIQPVTKTVAIEFVAPNATLAVEVNGEPAENRTQEVDINLQVSRSNRSKIEEFLQGQQAIRIEVRPTNNGDPEQIIDLKNELSTSALAERGAYIQSTDPPTTAVRLIELRTISLPIEPLLGELELSEEAPTFSPAQTQVTLPKDLADLAQAKGLSLSAMMNELDASSFVEDLQYVRKVKLTLPAELASPYAKFNPNTEVTFLVLKRTSDLTLKQVQVRVAISDLWTGKYQIQIDPDRFIEVQLRGPAEVIDRIDKSNELVWALLKLNSDDLTQGEHQAPLYILVPEGVTVVSPEPLQTMIDYTVSLTAQTP
jgi:hypothetical protein